MKVKELRRLLKNVDGDLLIVVSRDSEGNSYSPLSSVDDNCTYLDGDLGVRELTSGLRRNGFSEEDMLGDDATPCLCLWPV